MIRVYKGVGSNRNGRLGQVCDWLDRYNLEYEIITKKDLTKDIIKQMLIVSEMGFDEICVPFSTVSKDYQKMREVFGFKILTTESFIQIILALPIILKGPITFDEHFLLVGFNSEEIRKFLPKERKRKT